MMNIMILIYYYISLVIYIMNYFYY